MNIAKDILNSQTTKGSDTMSRIRSKKKGIDFCEMKNNFYIIRSDFGCYMKTRNLNKGPGVSIFNLHLSCKDGNHYIGHENGYFYIIKGNNYRRVKNLTTDREGKMYELHSDCRGGDHYFSANGKFYIIFKNEGYYRRTTDMTKNAEQHDLHPDCSEGIYYWGHKQLYFLKQVSEWGVQYCGSKDFSTDKFTCVYSVDSDVLNFLPGGLSVTKGPVFGTWENIKTVTNESDKPVTWTKKITEKVGYDKEKLSQITKSWKIATSASIETAAIATLIAKCQFSISAESEVIKVNTEKESWNTMTEEEEELKFELEPNESVNLLQYRIHLGEDQVLLSRHIKINRHKCTPLPTAQNIKA